MSQFSLPSLIKSFSTPILVGSVVICFLFCFVALSPESKIDRHALVTRHTIVLNKPDTLGSLSVGNGEFSFTVDVSGLQTFPAAYENGIPLGTQAQWGWHSIPQKEKYNLSDVSQEFTSCDGTAAFYPVQHAQGKKGEATRALRANPHRLHLGLIGLILVKENGEEAKLGELKNVDQQLDLWSGRIQSAYTLESIPVKVILYGHQTEDGIAVKIESPLIAMGRLRVKMDLPYGKDCHTCPGYDFENVTKHTSAIVVKERNRSVIKHILDSTSYFIHVNGRNSGDWKNTTPHHFELHPSKSENKLEFSVFFNQAANTPEPDFKSTKKNSIENWSAFWNSGAAIDFSKCTDARANELERRVVLSQYLTKIQCAGSMPPQETGLTMNSWFGKFHLEMHWWHASHFALWNRSHLMERSMPWYGTVAAKALATAHKQGYAGARWQKMTGYDGAESPSDIGAFIIWQQPHPVYLAELLYRNNPTKETLQKYQELVFSTADFLASFLKLRDGQYHLCHPLIPAQEIFKATETDDPAYELQYWYYALTTAQQWRIRLGMSENKTWKDIIQNLAPLSVANGLYLPTATTPQAYTDDMFRRDHPAVLGAYGFLPYNSRVDTVIMRNTFENIMQKWEWQTTWGWDYPLIAMTAARLNKPEQAIDALLMDVQKNTYLVNGHNYQDERLRLYLPGNGGLLAAVAMMAAGWDGNTRANPGFPKNEKWKVKWEGLHPMP